MSSAVLSALGIDPSDFSWKDLALCSGMETDDFYDNYESDVKVAKSIDQACLSCPVLNLCLEAGTSNSEWGVWGGVFLTSGKPDTNRNKHKTQDIWDAIEQRILEG